jgi:PAS domain S-box-containing protein
MKEKKETETLEMNTHASRDTTILNDLEKQIANSLKENRQLQLALNESDSRYNQLVQNLPAALYTCDREGRITLFNEAAVALWGRTPEIGKDSWCGSWKIYKPDGSELPIDECPMAVTLKEGRPVVGEEIIVERPDGVRRHVLPNPQPLFDSSGKLSGAVNMLIDVTDLTDIRKSLKNSKELKQKNEELRQRNEELRRSEDRYHRMIAEVEDYVIILLDENGNIQNWNKGAEKIKGYSGEEAIGKNFRIFYTEGDRELKLPDHLIQIAAEKGKATHEGWRIRKDGTKFWGYVVITALHDDENRIVGFSKVTRDLTERKLAEENLRSSAQLLLVKNKELEAKNHELASFAYVSSHDLQEPLRKIQTFSSRIIEMEDNKLSEKGRDYFIRMQNAALRMQTLIEDLLAYSRTNTAEQKFEKADLGKILEEVQHDLKEMIEEKKAVIEAEPLPTLNVIRFQITQLFTNIVTNALKFSRPNVTPHLRITVKKIQGSEIQHPHTDALKTYHEICFADNGIGFEPEYRHKIFEVFQRLHGRSEYSGTGIGLAICKKIVDNHDGLITADSVPEKGSSFYIYLPVQEN